MVCLQSQRISPYPVPYMWLEMADNVIDPPFRWSPQISRFPSPAADSKTPCLPYCCTSPAVSLSAGAPGVRPWPAPLPQFSRNGRSGSTLL